MADIGGQDKLDIFWGISRFLSLRVHLCPAYMFLGNFWEVDFAMPRTVRNAKLDTRSARARLPAKKSGYWVPIARGFALGYRKGAKGSVWLARLIDSKGRREAMLGSADDALDADGERILDYAQAQAKARDWLASLDAEGKAGPYTINRCLDDYIADYKRRGGKALDRLEITADAFIRPQLGDHEVGALTAPMIRQWHAAVAEAPARLRTRKTATRRNVRDIDLEDSDAVRQRRASANRIFGVLKAALNLAFREGLAVSDEAWRRVKPFREASAPIIPTILITAYPDDSARERALGDGVVSYLSKPFDDNDLLTCIRSSLNI